MRIVIHADSVLAAALALKAASLGVKPNDAARCILADALGILHEKPVSSRKKAVRRFKYAGKRIGRGVVYVLEIEDRVKIGKTGSMGRRLEQFARSLPRPDSMRLLKLFVVDDCDACEMDLHTACARWRTNGEWFNLPESVKRVFVDANDVSDCIQVLNSSQ